MDQPGHLVLGVVVVHFRVFTRYMSTKTIKAGDFLGVKELSDGPVFVCE